MRWPISRAAASRPSGVSPSAPACRATLPRISPAAPLAASKPCDAASCARLLADELASPTRPSSISLRGSALAIKPPISNPTPATSRGFCSTVCNKVLPARSEISAAWSRRPFAASKAESLVEAAALRKAVLAPVTRFWVPSVAAATTPATPSLRSRVRLMSASWAALAFARKLSVRVPNSSVAEAVDWRN